VAQEVGDSVVAGEKPEAEADQDALPPSRRGSIRRARILTFHEKRLLGLMGPDAVQYLRLRPHDLTRSFLWYI
jgi:hypothetical protein